MTVFDFVAGWTLITVTSLIYIYYTIWVIILPFVDKDQIIHDFFPDHKIALGIPLIAGTIGLIAIGTFVLFTYKGSKVKTE